MRFVSTSSMEEETLLREVWPVKSKEEILALFPGRDWRSLRRHASLRGLIRTSELTAYRHEEPIVLSATAKPKTVTLGARAKRAIQIRNLYKIADVLKQIAPCLIIKKPQTEIVLEFCNRRLNLPYGAPFTELDLACYNKLEAMNRYTRNQLKSTGTTDYRLSTIYTPSQETSSQTAS